jgi:lipopolysaccharide export system permease protein|tara:strand:- start:343 stop:1044 length:702 start_codon:yes stop_codon:yes gene_type:complete
MKSGYLEIKNRYSSDQKYLAVITENGFWIKDEIDTKINIINAGMIDGQFLNNVVITQFDENYNFLRTLQSPKVNISSTKWEMLSVKISMNGITNKQNKLQFLSSFDLKKINSLFSNLSSLTIYDLIKLKNIYNSLNYSTVDLDSHLLKITMYPIYLTLITILSAIIMFSIGYKKNTLFKIILGIFLSVVIYYINYFFNVLGTTEKIPVLLSIIFPLILLAIINTISIIRLNEK